MKETSDRRRLLDDILAEAAPAGFRGALLEQTLRAVRRRNQARKLNRGLLAAALFAGAVLALRDVFTPALPPSKSPLPALRVVNSEPLPPSMIVATMPGGAGIVSSSASAFALVETGSIKDPFREINDEQLLDLAAGRPVVLVRLGPRQAELLFLNPEDEEGFPVQ